MKDIDLFRLKIGFSTSFQSRDLMIFKERSAKRDLVYKQSESTIYYNSELLYGFRFLSTFLLQLFHILP